MNKNKNLTENWRLKIGKIMQSKIQKVFISHSRELAKKLMFLPALSKRKIEM